MRLAQEKEEREQTRAQDQEQKGDMPSDQTRAQEQEQEKPLHNHRNPKNRYQANAEERLEEQRRAVNYIQKDRRAEVIANRRNLAYELKGIGRRIDLPRFTGESNNQPDDSHYDDEAANQETREFFSNLGLQENNDHEYSL